MNIKLSLFFLFLAITAVRIQAMGPEAIHSAARKGDLAALQQCIDRDPTSINQRDNCGLTPLQQSCLSFEDHHNTETVRFLLDHGALVNTEDKWKCTPLRNAAYWAKAPIVRLLLRHNALIDHQADDGDTALHVAADQGHDTIVNVLLEGGALVDLRNADGQTPLHKAANWGRKSIVHSLLDHGASVDLKDKKGMTPYDLAVNSHERDSQAIAQLLEHRRQILEQYKLERYKSARLAFCSVLHSRLGAESPANALPQWVVKDILQLLTPRDF